MKILIFTLLVSFGLKAQTPIQLSETIHRLDNALVEKDTATLNLILHKDVVVVHSNGFSENKSEMKQNTISSFIRYNEIKQLSDEKYVKLNNESYIIYRDIEVDGIYDVYDFKLNLKLMEVWVWRNEHWQLIGRQSLEIESE